VARATRSGQLTNEASANSSTADPDPTGNVARATVDIARVATLTVTKTSETTSVVVGGNIVWTVKIRNAGPDVASDIAVTETLPSSVSFVSVSPSAGTYTSNDDTWRIASLAIDASATLTIITRANTLGTTTNTVTARWSEAPADAAVASAQVSVISAGRVPVTGSDSMGLLLVGSALLLIGGSLLVGARRRRRPRPIPTS
jgi:uncharacterized repeat protein (TIGR01451 family)/LPXTG-motif cell wall-anchored protein